MAYRTPTDNDNTQLIKKATNSCDRLNLPISFEQEVVTKKQTYPSSPHLPWGLELAEANFRLSWGFELAQIDFLMVEFVVSFFLEEMLNGCDRLKTT
ncbi:hypothetical protein B4U84_29845 [Westiellopsis prolifica IICB1]|nr:hypothetical protein B4U84_29845 [Westiellopsis prolifica IICB1]